MNYQLLFKVFQKYFAVHEWWTVKDSLSTCVLCTKGIYSCGVNCAWLYASFWHFLSVKWSDCVMSTRKSRNVGDDLFTRLVYSTNSFFESDLSNKCDIFKRVVISRAYSNVSNKRTVCNNRTIFYKKFKISTALGFSHS